MAKKTTKKAAVGAGDFGKALKALRAAAEAARAGNWSEVMTQVFTFFDEYRQTLAGEPMVMGAAPVSFKCPTDEECEDVDVEECYDKIDEFCDKHNKAKTSSEEAVNESVGVGAGGLDWATLIPLLLQLIAAWRSK